MRRFTLATLVLIATAGIIAGGLFGGLEGGDALWPLSWIVWAPVGGLILRKRPGNGVGLAMLSIGVAWGISFAFLAVAASSAPLEIRAWAEVVGAAFGVIPWLGILWLLLVFPAGDLAGRLERITGLGLVVVAAFGTLSFVVSPAPMETTGMPSPLSMPSMENLTAWFVEDGFVVVIVLLVLSIVALTRRWRSSAGVERHQYRWLLLGGLVFLLILGVTQFVPDDSNALFVWLVAGSAIPVSVGVAVSRYRLFEIDRIISRTLSYAIVVGLLAGVVATLATLVSTRFSDPLVVAGTTLAVATAFNPLRRRVQRLVDRRFNRSRYDAERIVGDFTVTLRDRVDPDGIVEGWLDVVADTMEPVVVGVWVRE